MFVQSHFQRARHQAAPTTNCSSSSSTSATAASSALATQLHHHHHKHQIQHHRQSTWSSGGSGHANERAAQKQQQQQQPPIEKRKSRLSSASSSVNSRDLLLVQSLSSSSSFKPPSNSNRITANGHSPRGPAQPTSFVPSQAAPKESPNEAYQQGPLQQTSAGRQSRFKSKSLSSLVELKQRTNLRKVKPKQGEEKENSTSGSRKTSEEATRNGISQQERRHLLWRKIIVDCSLKLGHLLTGKLFVSQPTATATTTAPTSRSLASTRRANFQLISSFCMSFIHYQLETWRLLVDGATSAHYHNSSQQQHQLVYKTTTGHMQPLHRQTSLNLAGARQPAPGAPQVATGQWHSANCCRQWHQWPNAETAGRHKDDDDDEADAGHQSASRVGSQPASNNSSHLLLPNHSPHSPLQLRHTVDGSPISAHHQGQVTPACFQHKSTHGHLIVAGGRSIGGPLHHEQHTLSSPTLADELRQAEWRTQQAHLLHHHHHHCHSNNHHEHRHHHHHHKQVQPNNQVRQTAAVAASDRAEHQMLTRTQTVDTSGFHRRRLAQDYGLLVDYGRQTGGSGGLIGSSRPNKLSPVSMRNTSNSHHHCHDNQMSISAESDHWASGRDQANSWLSSKPANQGKWMDGRTSHTGSVASSLAGSVKSAQSRLVNGCPPQGKRQHLQGDQQQQQQRHKTTSQSLSGKSTGSFISTASSSNKRTAANQANGSTSASLTKVSLAGAKRRLGFKLKGGHLSSLNVHRSEEVLPADVANYNNSNSNNNNHHLHQFQSYSINRFSHSPFNNSSAATTTTSTTVNSFNTSTDEMSGSIQNKSSAGKRQWLSVNWHQQQQQQPSQVNGQNNQLLEQQLLDPRASFVEGLGAGQVASRQALVSPYLGDIQLSLSDQRGMLEVEVIRVKQLQAKPSAKRLPSPYVKVYLMKEKKCVAKFKTIQMRWTLDPIYQQRFIFRDDYTDCLLQVIVWADYGKRDRKSLMGLAQIHLNELDISNVLIGWYKLFNAPSLTSSSSLSMSSSKQLRQTISSTKIGHQHQLQQQQPPDNESIEDNNDKQEAANDDSDQDELDDDQQQHNSYSHGGHADLDNDMYTSHS